MNTNKKPVYLQYMDSKSYKAISALGKRIVPFFFVLIFLFPGLDQLLHLLHNTTHGHHQMHKDHDLHFHSATDHCYILTFEYISLSNKLNIQTYYSVLFPISNIFQISTPRFFREILFSFSTPRAPPYL